jgi:hypothetical protein
MRMLGEESVWQSRGGHFRSVAPRVIMARHRELVPSLLKLSSRRLIPFEVGDQIRLMNPYPTRSMKDSFPSIVSLAR